MSKQQDIYRIMVLNWKWEDELAYPTDEDFGPESGLTEKLKAIPAANPNEKKGNGHSDAFEVLNPASMDAYVIPTRVWEDKEKELPLKAFTHSAIEAAKAVSNNNPFQLLLLLHKGEKTSSVEELANLDTSGLPRGSNMRVALFGGGRDIIYGREGLLDHGISTFLLGEDLDSGAAWFDIENEIKALIIKKAHFNFVWDSYWYQTRIKLEQFRKETLLAQLPKVPDGPVKRASVHAKSLLFRLDPVKYKSSKKQIPAPGSKEFDPIAYYGECADLENILHAPKLTEKRATWMTEIEMLAKEAQINNTQALNEAFDELHKSW